jgi:ABC-type transport system substrate-binding protein
VDFKLQGNLDFSQYLPLGEQKGFTGPFRYGWSFDYPAAESYLTPLFTPQSLPPIGSNYSFYQNQKVVDLIAQGDSAASEKDAIADYQKAEDLIAEDMPNIPMFFTKIQTVHTDRVDNVRIDLFQRPVWSEVTVNG